MNAHGIGGLVVPIDSGAGSVIDVDGTYRKWFADHGVVAALQRPDFVLFGTAAEPAQVAALLHSLHDSLQCT
jgi:3-(3-hydroxy-phenyl)propionate hydroxylase